jgi:hypothetical protein
MDGCWEPWLVGCRIDWQAWSALATLGAVVAALWIAQRERSDRRAAERAEGQLLATLLGDTFVRGLAVVEEVVDELDAHDMSGGFWRDQVAGDRAKAQAVFDTLSRLHLSEVERAAERLHKMPGPVARVIARAYADKMTLQGRLLELARLPINARDEQEDAIVGKAQVEALALLDSFEQAAASCSELELEYLGAGPRKPGALAALLQRLHIR